MNEREEQRILNLVLDAARRNDEMTHTELWVAARWLNGLKIRDRVPMQMAILQSSASLIWVTFLLDALRKLEVEHEEIADGVPFEHDGMTLVATRVEA